MRDHDLDEELRADFEMEIEERVQAGMSRADAEADARRAFGSVALIKEATRETWRGRSVERLLQDLRYALRLVRRYPAFAFAVVVSIALGVGAETAVFSVVHAVLLRPLAFRDPDRLIAIAEHPTGSAQDRGTVSGPDFDDLRDGTTAFQKFAAYLTFTFPLTDTDEPVMVRCTGISPEFFDALGMSPLLGRTYRPDEFHVDGGQAIISYGFWQRHFGGDRNVLGRTIYLNHAAHEVIGVMPPTTDLFDETDVWAKYIPDFAWARQRDNRFLSVIALLRPGVTATQAREQLQAVYRRIPGVPATAAIDVTPLKEQLVGGVRTALVVLLGAVCLVLLVACANVANLLLARGAARQREIATRYALGASRGRMIRQFLTESLVLSAIGGTAGVLLASALLNVFLRLDPELPRAADVRLDVTVLLFALVVTVAAAVAFTVAPVAAASRFSRVTALLRRR